MPTRTFVSMPCGPGPIRTEMLEAPMALYPTPLQMLIAKDAHEKDG